MLNKHLTKLQNDVETAIDMKEQYITGLLQEFNLSNKKSLDNYFQRIGRLHAVMNYTSQPIEPEVREFMCEILHRKVKFIHEDKLALIHSELSALESHIKRTEALLAECEHIMKYNERNGE